MKRFFYQIILIETMLFISAPYTPAHADSFLKPQYIIPALAITTAAGLTLYYYTKQTGLDALKNKTLNVYKGCKVKAIDDLRACTLPQLTNCIDSLMNTSRRKKILLEIYVSCVLENDLRLLALEAINRSSLRELKQTTTLGALKEYLSSINTKLAIFNCELRATYLQLLNDRPPHDRIKGEARLKQLNFSCDAIYKHVAFHAIRTAGHYIASLYNIYLDAPYKEYLEANFSNVIQSDNALRIASEEYKERLAFLNSFTTRLQALEHLKPFHKTLQCYEVRYHNTIARTATHATQKALIERFNSLAAQHNLTLIDKQLWKETNWRTLKTQVHPDKHATLRGKGNILNKLKSQEDSNRELSTEERDLIKLYDERVELLAICQRLQEHAKATSAQAH